VILSEYTGAHIHLQHISSKFSVDVIRRAKQRGARITAEATPHHIALTDDALATYDPNFKMNPPLRSAADREAILGAVADGTIEILCSDHAPHCDYEKEVEFDYAPFGITGLEIELALSLMQLVHTKRLSLADMIAKFTVNPARLLNLNKGTLSIGADADVTVFDLDQEWVYNREESASKSKNNPFFGWKLKGRTMATIVGGKKVFSAEAEPVMA
jgi:dihydroorotase